MINFTLYILVKTSWFRARLNQPLLANAWQDRLFAIVKTIVVFKQV